MDIYWILVALVFLVLELYQGMDAFLLPSLFEGLPLTGVEA